MRKFVMILLSIMAGFAATANHTKGGWMYYKYLGPGSSNNSAKYQVTLKVYTECFLNTNQWCAEVNISIFQAANNSLVSLVNVPYSDSVNIQNCTLQECHPCINPIPNICYKISTFEFIRELPITTDGYIISYQRCCRIANIINLQPGSSSIGDTWTVSIPGTGGDDPLAYTNSSAVFAQNDTAIICKENYFTFDFSSRDIDNDSLVYLFTDAYYAPQGGLGQCTGQSSSPPFLLVNYSLPFSGSQPMGSTVTINPVTGIVSGIAPGVEGTYVLTCTVLEYKRGTNTIKSAVHKSLHISVADCSLTQAMLDPEYYSCDGFTKTFRNNSSGGNIKTYFWDFGVQGSANDTSGLAVPTFVYPDTGTYVLKLYVNRNLPCSDSTMSIVKVYPVLAGEFVSQGQCKNTPIGFLDMSATTYGIINSWLWNFGDQTSATNVSTIQNPTHVYINEANYQVSLIVANTKGCRDTVINVVSVTDKPAMSITNDTLICVIDTLRLNVAGTGTVLWSPNYNISDLTSASPMVSPDIPTKYYVTLSDPYGCSGKDSVFVDVKFQVTQSGGNDTVICRSDQSVLQLSSDALNFRWTEVPSGGSLNNPLLKNPLATPLTTTTYRVNGSIGKCFAENEVVFKVVPYPPASAGADTTVCFGSSAQLHAGGGSFYSWSPSQFLTNRAIANPVALKPTGDMQYIVTVTDTMGCPKPVRDTIVLMVVKINADAGPADTAVVAGQPLVLNASGSTNYLWSPAQWLSSPVIANPVALPKNYITYTVRVSNAAGCFDYDSIRVKLFTVDAGLYAPTAFSPNRDGRNDYFRLIVVGMKSLDLFRVYNRWGQLLFSDTNAESGGWDGTFAGREQEPATYVWYAEGTDYRNSKLKRKGYIVLIR